MIARLKTRLLKTIGCTLTRLTIGVIVFAAVWWLMPHLFGLVNDLEASTDYCLRRIFEGLLLTAIVGVLVGGLFHYCWDKYGEDR